MVKLRFPSIGATEADVFFSKKGIHTSGLAPKTFQTAGAVNNVL